MFGIMRLLVANGIEDINNDACQRMLICTSYKALRNG